MNEYWCCVFLDTGRNYSWHSTRIVETGTLSSNMSRYKDDTAHVQSTVYKHLSTVHSLLHCTLAAVQCIVISPVCLWWVCVCVFVCLWVCHNDNSKLGLQVKVADHLQLVKFWPSRAPGTKFLAPPCSQCAVFASPPSAF